MAADVTFTRVSRRRMLSLGGGLVGAMLLAACNQATPSPSASAPSTGGSEKSATPAANAPSSSSVTTINWITPAAVGLERDFYTGFMEDFQNANPNVKIQVSFEAWNDYFVKLPTVLAGGTIPDTIHLHGSIAQEYGLKGAVKNLFDYMKRDNVSEDDFFPFLIEQMADYKTKSKLWALPKDSAVYAVYYNKDMFDKAGLPYPKSDWTLDDFRTIAKELTVDRNGNPASSSNFDPKAIAQWGMQWTEPWPSGDGWQSSVWGIAGPWYNEDYTKANFDSPEHIDFLQQIADMRNKDHSIPTAGEAMGQGDPWRNGLTAMKIDHHANVFFYKEEKKTFAFDVNFSIAGKHGQFQGAACSGWAVPVQAPNPDLGWAFVKFLCGEAQQCRIVSAKRWGSAVKACEENLLPDDNNPPSFKQVLVDPMMGEGSIKTLAILYPPFLSEMKQIWQTEFDPVFTGGSVSAADAAKKVQPQIQALLDRAASM